MYYLKVLLLSVVAILLWVAIVVFGALNGWWSTAIAPTSDTHSFIDAAIKLVESKNRGNLAFVVIENGEIFEEYFSSTKDEVTRDTIFPTASMSKWITATSVMHLVQQGLLDLDTPVSAYLSRWHLPDNKFDSNKVTTRLLLSHMSGLNDGLGFGDYNPEETIPTLESSLTRPRASGEREVTIELGVEPGTEFHYSGGGYLILELLVEEISEETFEAYVRKNILEPLLMSRSGFAYLGDLDNASKAYDPDGLQATHYRYAASGATGFSTSIADLTRFVQFYLGKAQVQRPLPVESLVEMRAPHASVFGATIWGLGTTLYAPSGSGDYIFGHDGQNEPAINSAVRINPDNGDALIALVSGGPSLATELGYEWTLWQTGLPDVLHTERTIRRMLPTIGIGSALILVVMFVMVLRNVRSKKKKS